MSAISFAASPSPSTQHSFENLRARWTNNQIYHPFITLSNHTTLPSKALDELSTQLQKHNNLTITFSGISTSSDGRVFLVPDEQSASLLRSLPLPGTAVKDLELSLYSGPSAQSVLKELEKESFHTSFNMEVNGLTVLLSSGPSPTIFGKVSFGEPTWVFRSSNYINGEWKGSAKGRWLPVYNPATGQPVHFVSASTSEDVNEAVNSAQKAFATWKHTTTSDKANFLNTIADEISNRKTRIAYLETLDNGKSLAEANMDVDDTIACFKYYADHILKLKNEEIDNSNPSFSASIINEPLGVAALIIPWNYPLLMAAWKVAPCLAAGCCCILKPSELTPLSALELSDIIDHVGVPKGVFNLVLGYGPDCGAPLSSHPGVAKVAFTGSVPTGAAIYAAGAATIKRVSLELGGKSPLIVCPDADIEQAVDWISTGIFINSGQVCSATSRLLVHSSVQEELLSKLLSRTKSITVGPGLNPETKMGPLISQGQLQKVMGYISSALDQGAKLSYGGKRPSHLAEGYFLEPTIFVDVKPFMKIWKEEIFGPVLSVMVYDDIEDAIRLANDSPYGLAGAVFSGNKENCQKIAQQLECGLIWINCSQPTMIHLPWGGFKQSGTGRELGPWGLSNFLEPKCTLAWVDPSAKGWDWFAPPEKN